MAKNKQQKKSNTHVWVIPIVLVIVMTLGVSGYYAYSLYDKNLQQQIQESSRLASESASESAELEAMRQTVDIDLFYDGVFINDIDCSGKTYDEIRSVLEKQDADWRRSFSVSLKYGGTVWKITAADTVLTSDWETILEQAWQTGRTSQAGSETDQIRERYATVLALKDHPLHLAIEQSFDRYKLINRIFSLAEGQYIEPLPAVVTGFDRSALEFIIEDKQPGLKLDTEAATIAALNFLEAGQYGEIVEFASETLETGIGAAALKRKLGLVSEGITKTSATQTANRAHNITLVCKAFSTVYLLPGEIFSFNGYIGERTAEKGYLEAGGILKGVLEEDVIGGGICQPNTTLCHAVLKADLEIVERLEHSFPSTYTEVGLDATVSWPSKDFKFKNNTEYPIAIVAFYKKPNVVVRIYGRLLEEGVTISLESAITERNPCTDPPVEQFDPELLPGERKLMRHTYDEIRAIAFKIWMKDGKVIRREEIFKSYYKDYPELYRYGPPLPTPTPTPTVAPTPTPTETMPTDPTSSETSETATP